ncbi:hypothetical protein BJ912DRAFT_1141039 [Pholiota molesta]|nr:hypothetical protein BJ912DRAFT_1141039 [Pholiota molesta]
MRREEGTDEETNQVRRTFIFTRALRFDATFDGSQAARQHHGPHQGWVRCFPESDRSNLTAPGEAAETAATPSRCGAFHFGGRDIRLARVGLAVVCVRLDSEATRNDKHHPNPPARDAHSKLSFRNGVQSLPRPLSSRFSSPPALCLVDIPPPGAPIHLLLNLGHCTARADPEDTPYINARSPAIRAAQEAIPTRTYRRAHRALWARTPDRLPRRLTPNVDRCRFFADAVIARVVAAAPYLERDQNLARSSAETKLKRARVGGGYGIFVRD